ncbi:MAG: insulinase family protein, partial [Woeseia sp.]
SRQFMIGYRAPSVHSPDYPAFVVLQQILGASSGVSFLQNDWGTPVAKGAVLAGAAESLTTWYPPSEQEFLFVIGGSAGARVDESRVEEQIEKRIASLRRRGPSARMLTAAVETVLHELTLDIESTEDAAHQLAFFEGLHALDVLLALPDRIAAVTTADVQHAAQTYLQPGQRTIAWLLPRPPAERADPGQALPPDLDRSVPPVAPVDRIPVPEPVLRTLRGGVPVMVQASDLSPNAQLRIVLPGNRIVAENLSADDPVTGYSSMTYGFRKERLAATLDGAAADLAKAGQERSATPAPSTDPASRMEQVFGEFMGGTRQSDSRRAAPAFIAVSGDVDVNETLDLLERYFGLFEPAALQPATATDVEPGTLIVKLGRQVAQAQLGYIVNAPGPGDARADAYRLLLYILSHDYEGRLGKKAISDRGLAYYIDSHYRSDGADGWVTMSVGVDPGKIAPLRELLAAELNRLLAEPPTAAEVEEAKNHLVGRARSAAQTNDELTRNLAREWLWYGERMSADALALRLAQVRRQDVLDVIGAFTAGTTIVVQE